MSSDSIPPLVVPTLPVQDASTVELVDTVYAQVRANIKDFSKLTAPEITQMILVAMGRMNQFKNMPGSSKNVVVCKVAEMLINDMPEGELKIASQVMITFLPSLISNIIEYTKGKFDLNKDGVVTEEEVKTVCFNIFSCFKCCK